MNKFVPFCKIKTALIPVPYSIFWVKSSFLEPPCGEHAMANLKFNFYLQNLKQSTTLISTLDFIFLYKNSLHQISPCAYPTTAIRGNKKHPEGCFLFPWWRRWELNPRPNNYYRLFYMFSRFLYFEQN